jgi:predicted dehydrogenase
MNPVSIGLIGPGFHARSVHLPALALVPELRLVAVAASKHSSTQHAAEHFRAKGYIGHEALLEQADVEAVIIAAPAPTHDQLVRAALECGKHVLVESPGVNSMDQARANLALAAEKKLIVQVGFCTRYSTTFDLLREHLATVLPPRLFSYEYFPFLGHTYNLALYLSGLVDRIVPVTSDASGSTTTLRFKNQDAAVIVGRLLVNCSIDIESVRVSTATFFGEVTGRRRVRIIRGMRPSPPGAWSVGSAQGMTFEAQPFGARFLEIAGYAPQLRAFAAAVRGGAPPRCTLQDAIDTADVAQEIARATKPSGS